MRKVDGGGRRVGGEVEWCREEGGGWREQVERWREECGGRRR